MKTQNQIRARLEELRVFLRTESMSYGELHELQSLANQIEADDIELLEAAGVPEFPDRETQNRYRMSLRGGGEILNASGNPINGPEKEILVLAGNIHPELVEALDLAHTALMRLTDDDINSIGAWPAIKSASAILSKVQL